MAFEKLAAQDKAVLRRNFSREKTSKLKHRVNRI